MLARDLLFMQRVNAGQFFAAGNPRFRTGDDKCHAYKTCLCILLVIKTCTGSGDQVPNTLNVKHHVEVSSQRHALAALFLWKELPLPMGLGTGWTIGPGRMFPTGN
jgi:hypothetical protein